MKMRISSRRKRDYSTKSPMYCLKIISSLVFNNSNQGTILISFQKIFKTSQKYKPKKKYLISYSRLSLRKETKEKNDEDSME